MPTVFPSQAVDTALVQSARDGNRAAFGELYGRYQRMVHGILLAHVSYTDAEDLMQTVFMQAMQRLPALRETEAFGGWLAAIARNLANDHHRRRKNLVGLTESECGSAPAHEPEQALEAIRRLPEAYRETLMLRLVEGMTGPEIAARTGLTADSVRVNLCRGMKLLRAELEGKGKHA
ncbi:MAG: sigma-70 family RNA polymerase sigma factor, partial [Acidobacteriota bacterium]|nr:sigma-70 family RNA polymerase sigma factor [Acidobacteriota bacterium]